MCGFCDVWVCVCVGVCMCGFCNVWVCVCVGFVMCGCFDNCVRVVVICTCIYCFFVLFVLFFSKVSFMYIYSHFFCLY